MTNKDIIIHYSNKGIFDIHMLEWYAKQGFYFLIKSGKIIDILIDI